MPWRPNRAGIEPFGFEHRHRVDCRRGLHGRRDRRRSGNSERATPGSPRSHCRQFPLFVPGMSMGAALFIFWRSFLDLKLGYWAVFLGHVVWALPFSLLMVLVIAVRF